MQAPLALQIGRSGEMQSAELKQWTHVLVYGSQRGAVEGHCAFERQATHWPVVTLHRAAPDEVQSVF